jgi:hypothetical protein
LEERHVELSLDGVTHRLRLLLAPPVSTLHTTEPAHASHWQVPVAPLKRLPESQWPYINLSQPVRAELVRGGKAQKKAEEKQRKAQIGPTGAPKGRISETVPPHEVKTVLGNFLDLLRASASFAMKAYIVAHPGFRRLRFEPKPVVGTERQDMPHITLYNAQEIDYSVLYYIRRLVHDAPRRQGPMHDNADLKRLDDLAMEKLGNAFGSAVQHTGQQAEAILRKWKDAAVLRDKQRKNDPGNIDPDAHETPSARLYDLFKKEASARVGAYFGEALKSEPKNVLDDSKYFSDLCVDFIRNAHITEASDGTIMFGGICEIRNGELTADGPTVALHFFDDKFQAFCYMHAEALQLPEDHCKGLSAHLVLPLW